MLKDNNIYLRKIEEKDLNLKVKWVNDEKINETLLFDYPVSLSETKEWYKKTFFNRSRWDFVIIERNTDKVIGMTGLININLRHKNAQFFITIGEIEAQGKGYGRGAIFLVLEYAFLELGLEKIYLLTLSNNIKARKLYESVGFKQEALLKNEYHIHGNLNDIYRHAIFRENLDFGKK